MLPSRATTTNLLLRCVACGGLVNALHRNFTGERGISCPCGMLLVPAARVPAMLVMLAVGVSETGVLTFVAQCHAECCADMASRGARSG